MSDKTVTLHIDDVAYDVPAGMNLVDAARIFANVEIPIFCYHPKMDPVGMCRMCLVDVGFEMRDRATGEPMLNEDGTPQIRWGNKLETGCTMNTSAGMHIRTKTDEVTDARKNVLEFLLSSHPLDCPICDKGGECPLQNLTMRHGPSATRMAFEDKLHLDKHVPLGDLIYLDRERCIQCARCVRFQDEVVGDDVLGFHERGRKLQIITISDPPFDTYFSGNTTDICPVGALTTADFRFGARIWEMENVASVSPHGPVGENIVASTRLDRDAGGVKVIKRILPRQNEDVNEIWISDKTRFGHHFSQSPDRLQTPFLRKKGELVPSDWQEAVKVAAKVIKDAGKNVAFIGGAMTTNEDYYTMRELAGELGSKQLGVWPVNLGDASPVAEVGIASGSRITELGAGDAVLVIASDLEEEAPVWFLQVKQAADRGARVLVANMRETKLDRYADVMRYRSGEAVTVLNSLTGSAIKEGVTSEDTLKRVNGFDDLKDALKSVSGDHGPLAKELAAANNVVIFAGNEGLDYDGHSALLQAAANLLIVTGHVGKRNNGLVPVWPGANTQGAFDLGFTTANTRALLGSAPDVVVVVGAAVHEDAVYSAILDEAKTVIALNLFEDGVSEKADVVLPIQSFAEREGTYTNAMRRVQRLYTLHGPVGESLPAWKAIAMIGEKAGYAKPRRSPALVMKAITENEKAYAEMSYANLGKAEPQFPPIGESPGFYGGASRAANIGGTGIQWPSKAEGRGKLTVKPVSADPLHADAGLIVVPVRRLYDRAPEFYASELMHGHVPVPFVALNAHDAEPLGIDSGDTITLTRSDIALTLTAMVDDAVPQGIVLLPVGLSEEPIVPVPFVATVTVAVEDPAPVG